MYPDAFSVERLALELSTWLNDGLVKDIFSTSKTDLFFVLGDKKGFKIQLYCGEAFFRFPGIEKFPVKNRMSQFSSLHSQKIISVNGHFGSRSFDILFEGEKRLVFKLFGKFSNIILFDRNDPGEIFCSNLPKDLENPFSHYSAHKLTLEQFNHEAAGLNEVSFSKTFKWFPQDALDHLSSLNYFESEQREDVFRAFGNQYRQGEVHILKKEKDVFLLSCFPALNIDDVVIGSYNKITEAMNDLSGLYIAAESFKDKQLGHITVLQKQVAKKQKLLNDLMTTIEVISKKRSYSEFGDMIMANLHSIHKGVSTIEVLDFYNNSKLLLKLKPDLSPQENAALYYRKAKNQVKEIEFKQKALTGLKSQIESLGSDLEKLRQMDDSAKLRKFDKSGNHKLKTINSQLPFKLYEVGGFDILVGKNAKANDELISGHASKNDTWLHARDVSGSHVIIKNPGSKPIPARVLEAAASLAAWHSKARSNSLASVIYTLRKFVRKPKGSEPGQVIVEKEKGLLVKPEDHKLKA